MRISVVLAYLGFALLLGGCGAKRIDASSKEKMEHSVKEVRASLPVQDREKFDAAVAELGLSKLQLGDLVNESAENIQDRIKSSLNGKTAKEVLTEGQALIDTRRAKERTQAEMEIKELTEKKQRAEKAQKELAGLKVTKSRFYKREQRFGGPTPGFEIQLENGTSMAVSRVYFRGTLASPGRSVPWVRDTFNYSIPGGLEPGEAKQLNLAPNQFGPWGEVEAPNDAVFTVEVIRLDGPTDKDVLNPEVSPRPTAIASNPFRLSSRIDHLSRDRLALLAKHAIDSVKVRSGTGFYNVSARTLTGDDVSIA